MFAIQQRISKFSLQQLFILAVVFIALCFGSAIALESQVLFLIPFLLVVVGFVIWDFRILYVLFLLTIPFSIEIFLPSGLGTDLPSEPIMIVLTGIGILLYLSRIHLLDYSYLRHPITIMIVLHICWIAIAAISSQNHLISFKYLLAKIWYIVPFFFMPFIIVRSHRESKKALYLLLFPLMMAVIYVLIRHYGFGFSFKTSNKVVYPIFRNHVNYASILVMFLPFVYGLREMDKEKIWRNIFLGCCIIVLVIAIYFSYTRAAQGCIVIAIASYFMIKYKLTKAAILGAILSVLVVVLWLVHDNTYLKYAPNFQNTVSHFKFDNLIEATYKLEDISTMERVHRWVAGSRMIAEKPILGFGPGCFYSSYKDYTLTEFKTWVSHNPEKSGIHNYYLMTMVEQGVFGFLIFILLLIFALIKGEALYHRSKDKNVKILVMSAMVSIIVCATILFINDMLEADKVGPIFFFSLAIIVIYDVLENKKERNVIS